MLLLVTSLRQVEVIYVVNMLYMLCAVTGKVDIEMVRLVINLGYE